MKIELFHQTFRPLFGLERRETTARFLYAILSGGLLIDLAVVWMRLASGETFSTSSTLQLLAALFVLQGALLFLVRQGYVNPTALMLVVMGWISITYQAWSADGVRDVSIYVYVLLIFVAALLTNWQLSVTLSVLSIVSVWTMAWMETQGLRPPTVESPLNIARDLTAIFIVFFLLIYLVINTIRYSLDAVRQSEEKFRRIFHVSPVAIAMATLEEGRLMDANQAYWKLTGLDPGFAIGKTTLDLGSWSSLAERQKFVAELKERKSLQNPAYRIRSTSGGERTTLAFYELIDFARQPAILAMFYDVTEQTRAKHALEASEQKYRNFVEQSMEGVWFLAFDHPIPLHLPHAEQAELIYQYGYISESNDVLAQMYGYASSAEIRGVRLLDLQPGGTPSEDHYKATLQLVQESYRSGSRETCGRSRDGRTVYFLNNAVGVFEQNCLVGLWGTQLDITVLKRTEEALRQSEARTRALLDAIPDMIFEFKRDGTVLQFIASAISRPLFPPEDFLGRRVQDVLPSSVADQTTFAIERVLDSGQVHAFEYQLHQGGENRTFEARITPLSEDTVLAIVRDVSLQRWILGEREQLIGELERKNMELERFTYTVSHDLKSPLITIKGFLGFLQEDARRGNLRRLDADLKRIGAAADRMQHLLNDLLELSRIGRSVNKFEIVDLNALVVEVIELLQGRLSGGVTPIQLSVQKDLVSVYGDRARLLEVWQNLIDNAAKFMGDQPDPQIEIGQLRGSDTGEPTFFVRDNGIGIDPGFHERIFGLFDQLHPRSDGTGIGLALVKRILEVHGGRIWVESAAGKGTTFYFTLPGGAASA